MTLLFLDTEFTGLAQRWPHYRGAYFTPTKPEHHSWHDAKALRQSWQRAKALDAFQAYAAKLGL